MMARRWSALALAGVIAISMLSACAQPRVEGESEAEQAESYVRPEKVDPAGALALLRDGNERFVRGEAAEKDISAERRKALADGQSPFAVVVTCSDSRLAPEFVFDQALGDLFVVRVAGNVIDPVALGSVEYAVDHLDTPLVVVLGHEACGAVEAAAEGGKPKGSVGEIVEMIEPALAKAKASGLKREMLVEETVDVNIANQLKTLNGSQVLKERRADKKLTIVGAKYSLESGEVEWLD